MTEPRTWQISKVNRISPPGIAIYTCAQTLYDPHTDLIETDQDGNVIGMYADYYKVGVKPDDNSIHDYSRAKITFSGVKPQLKIGGSYKKFTVTFSNPVDPLEGEWAFAIDGEDVSSILTVLTPEGSTDLSEGQIKIKAPNDASYIGKILNVSYTRADGVSANIDVEMVAL